MENIYLVVSLEIYLSTETRTLDFNLVVVFDVDHLTTGAAGLGVRTHLADGVIRTCQPSVSALTASHNFVPFRWFREFE